MFINILSITNYIPFFFTINIDNIILLFMTICHIPIVEIVNLKIIIKQKTYDRF
jgi:hypothetical protein